MTNKAARVLVVDDEPEMAESLRLILGRAGYDVLVETQARRAVDAAIAERPDVVLTDLQMPDLDGLGLVEQLAAHQCAAPVVVLTGYASIDSAVDAMRRGAADYLAKPFDPTELLLRIQRALAWSRMAEQNRYLREQAETDASPDAPIGTSHAFTEVLRLVDRVAATDARILIVGASGTGKELLARTVHRRSLRRDMSFVAVDCGALGDGRLESELFGHERGAVPGSSAAKKGLLDVADGGTLFLDEIAATTPSVQAKLLRVAQQEEFLRLGGVRPIRADVRILASTSHDPRQAVAAGLLREDLFYRLGVVQIAVPPLSERAADVPLLAAHFVAVHARQIKKRVAGIDPDALRALETYHWPGNVRELENVVERAIIMADEGGSIGVDHLPEDLLAPGPLGPPAPMHELQDAEREILLKALRECDWNRSRAARKLGIGRRTLYDKLARHGISLRGAREEGRLTQA